MSSQHISSTPVSNIASNGAFTLFWRSKDNTCTHNFMVSQCKLKAMPHYKIDFYDCVWYGIAVTCNSANMVTLPPPLFLVHCARTRVCKHVRICITIGVACNHNPGKYVWSNSGPTDPGKLFKGIGSRYKLLFLVH